jgi:transcriptional regulator with XRE-family HTH domain
MEIFNLKEFRERHGITQKELCTKTGIRQAALLEIERGHRPLNLGNRKKIFVAYGLEESKYKPDTPVI